MPRRLLIVSGGAEAVPGIRRAKELGCEVAVSDGNPAAPGFGEADHRLVVSTYDAEGTLAAARELSRRIGGLDGVMCVASDVPLTVATVAAGLGLPGIPLESARLASDKLAMKERFRSAGIPVPWFVAVGSEEELKEVVSSRGFPLILKPVDSRGARGVLRLSPGTDLAWAFAHSRGHSPTGRVMVEEYLAGPQISTESVLLDGTAATPGFCDRNYEHLDRYAPFVIENGGEQPTALAEGDRERVARLAEAAGRALGVARGTAKGDMVLTPEGPRVIEVALRLSGGWFATDQIPLGTGVDFLGIAIRLALGEEIAPGELTPRHRRGVAIRYFFPTPGRVTGIEVPPDLASQPWIHRMGFFVEKGEVLPPVTDHTKRAGYVITTGRDREEALARAREVCDRVRIGTEAG